MGLREEMVGDLAGHAQQERSDCGPPGESAGPNGKGAASGQPGPQSVGGICLDADRQRDCGFEVEGIPYPGQRVDLPEPRHLADSDPSVPDCDCGRQR